MCLKNVACAEIHQALLSQISAETKRVDFQPWRISPRCDDLSLSSVLLVFNVNMTETFCFLMECYATH